MFTLWSDIDRLFNHSFSDMFSDRMMRRFEDCDAYAGACRMNLMDRGETLEFVAELPGVAEKDMNLTVHNDTLTLSAKREVSHDKENLIYLAERGNYNVQRSIGLPVRVDAEKATATFKNGVLRVILPKAPENQPKQIAINA
ncbi:MAG: Hsp20/alpha crystallin family protein [Proteobacteria bacterium]|nr:Hsp20/alpha crystallin family protein [Pseudomonadota bacterium]MBQ9243692.1 Hsp20/alpha crystallin family protein [Pseudomonadota bacterium]